MSVVDNLYKTLGDLGFVGALPDRMYNHLGSLGHTGAMSDRFSKEGSYRLYTGGLLSGDYSENYSPLQGITEVWIYGASISERMIEGFEDTFAQKLGVLGVPNLTFVNKSVGGRAVDETLVAWEAEKATITGRTDIMIVTHCMGNTVSANRPWASLTAPEQQAIFDDYQALIDSMVANGQVVMPVGTSFRDYDGTTVANEGDGSKPFNDNVVYPITAGITPNMTNGDGACYIDYYNWSRNYNEYVLFTDNVHWNGEAPYQMGREIMAQSIANRILGNSPLIFDRVETPVNNEVLPREDITSFSLSKSTGSEKVFGANFVGAPTNYNLVPLGSYLPNSVHVTQVGWDSPYGNGSTFNTGDNSISLTNDTIKASGIQYSSDVWVDIQVRTGYLPNQFVDLTVASFRSVGTTSSRRGDFSVDGGVTFVTIDASTQNVNEVDHYHTFNAQADATGTLILKGRVSSGSSFLHFNGAHAVPLDI